MPRTSRLSPSGSRRVRRERRSGRVPRDSRDQVAHPAQLVVGELGEVLVAEQLQARGADLDRLVVLVLLLATSRASPRPPRRRVGRARGSWRRAAAEARARAGTTPRTHGRRSPARRGGRRASGEARSRRRRGTSRSTASRPRSASVSRPGPDLEPGLAQHAAERHDVPDDRVPGAARPYDARTRAPPRRVARASRPGRRRCPRGTSAQSRASAGRPRRRAPGGRARRAPSPSRSSPRRPGGLARSRPRRPRTKAAASTARRSGIPGTRSRTIAISRSIDGWPIQWYSARRLSASCSSRVRFEVRITAGRRARADRARARGS